MNKLQLLNPTLKLRPLNKIERMIRLRYIIETIKILKKHK